jgi:hypothetical protein
VSAANTDLANSDALQMAQLVDAEGARTIGKEFCCFDVVIAGFVLHHVPRSALCAA